MTELELRNYVDRVSTEKRLAFYIDRLFRTNEEWDRISAHDFRNVNLSTRTEPTLDKVLDHRSVIILGEAGSGKSTVARAAVGRAIARSWIPVVGDLREYAGDLNGLLATRAPVDLVQSATVEGRQVTRAFILDGFDELPYDRIEAFIADLEAKQATDERSRWILTSRQAFYADNRSRLRSPCQAFYLLDLSARDVRTFVTHEGGDYDGFMAEVNRVGLGDESRNPFALEVLHRAYRDRRTLGRLRSDAVEQVVDSLIASRPAVAADRQRRALRMLAVAMETASRNVLTDAEAVLLIRSASPLSETESVALLNELSLSILVRTTTGIAFQMRSYGEYLAAKELQYVSLDKLCRLLWHAGTCIPNESWRNCIRYLAELHSGVRRHFASCNPDWVVSASPEVFSEAERTRLIDRLLGGLSEKRQYVLRHPTLNPLDVARFVTPDVEAHLVADALSDDDRRCGNALAILGAHKGHRIIPTALGIAFDRSRSSLLRASAIAALVGAGDASLIPVLLAQRDPTDPLDLSVVDCIGALMDTPSIPTILPLLLGTDALVSSAFYRFRELCCADAITVFLDFLLANPAEIQSSRLSSYADPLWEGMADHWQPSWAEKLATLIVTWEGCDVSQRDVESLIVALEQLPGRHQVVRLVLQGLLVSGHHLLSFIEVISRLVTEDIARWLVDQPNAERLVSSIAWHAPPGVKAILAPHSQVFTAQEQAASRQRREREHQQEVERRAVQEKQETIRSSPNADLVFAELARLPLEDWPDLETSRQLWLQAEVQRLMIDADPVNTTVWLSENQWQYRVILPWLVRATDHYNLDLADDVPLVQSLLAGLTPHVASYYRRWQFSAAAVAEFERLLAQPTTRSGALYHFLEFLQKTDLSTPRILPALVSIAVDNTRPEHLRSEAIHLCTSRGASDEDLANLSLALAQPFKDEVEDVLVERQHRPTIERRLASLLADPNQLAAGDVRFHMETPLGWVGKIRIADVWPRLVQLREQTLRLRFAETCSLITETMNSIDGVRLAGVVRDQIPQAPVEWQEVQRLRAVEYERDARLREAQRTPFEEVIRRLRRATTLGLFKIWCEGVTDGPTIDEFVQKLPSARGRDIVTDSLGGWNRILSASWRPDRLADGCHDLVVLLDGDKGRDWNAPGHPLNERGERVRQKLAEAGIQLVVLERYGVENYFTQSACESVLGEHLSGLFPLSPHREPQLPKHDKNQNPAIARQMSVADLAGTDLLRFLNDVAARSVE